MKIEKPIENTTIEEKIPQFEIKAWKKGIMKANSGL